MYRHCVKHMQPHSFQWDQCIGPVVSVLVEHFVTGQSNSNIHLVIVKMENKRIATMINFHSKMLPLFYYVISLCLKQPINWLTYWFILHLLLWQHSCIFFFLNPVLLLVKFNWLLLPSLTISGLWPIRPAIQLTRNRERKWLMCVVVQQIAHYQIGWERAQGKIIHPYSEEQMEYM